MNEKHQNKKTAGESTVPEKQSHNVRQNVNTRTEEISTTQHKREEQEDSAPPDRGSSTTAPEPEREK